MTKWTSEKIDQIRKLRIEGLTNAEIAEKLGTTSDTIKHIIAKHKLFLSSKMRKARRSKRFHRMWETRRDEIIELQNKNRPRFWTPERKEKLKELIERGLNTYAEIAQEIGCSKTAIENAASRFGFHHPEYVRSEIASRINKQIWYEKYLDFKDAIRGKLSKFEMGYIISVSSSLGRVKPKFRITICSKNIPFLKFFLRAFTKVMGKKLNIKKYKYFSYSQVIIRGRPIIDTIFWKNKIRTMHFFHARSLDFWRGFLQGLFDAKCKVLPHKPKWQIRLIMPRGECLLLRLMRKCLKALDIDSKLNFHLGRRCRMALTISDNRRNFENFRDMIGFRHSEKKQALEELIGRFED